MNILYKVRIGGCVNTVLHTTGRNYVEVRETECDGEI
jgi:hypothetical protein